MTLTDCKYCKYPVMDLKVEVKQGPVYHRSPYISEDIMLYYLCPCCGSRSPNVHFRPYMVNTESANEAINHQLEIVQRAWEREMEEDNNESDSFDD